MLCNESCHVSNTLKQTVDVLVGIRFVIFIARFLLGTWKLQFHDFIRAIIPRSTHFRAQTKFVFFGSDGRIDTKKTIIRRLLRY